MACDQQGGPSTEGPPSEERLRRAKARAVEVLGPLDGFQGAGIGRRVVRVYLRDAAAGEQVPVEIDGVPVETMIVGQITTR